MQNNSNPILNKKRIEEKLNAWFDKKRKNSRNSGNKSGTNYENTNTDTNTNDLLLDLNGGPFKKCLSKKSEDQLKLASWNFFRHILSLVRMHSSSRQQQSLSSLFRSSSSSMKTNHNLILSSEFQEQLQQKHQNDEGHDLYSLMILVKAAHDASFDEYVASGAYCELDLDTLFDDKEFVRFVFF